MKTEVMCTKMALTVPVPAFRLWHVLHYLFTVVYLIIIVDGWWLIAGERRRQLTYQLIGRQEGVLE